ncbi:hypothetical protein M569_04937, partial [Genlisea aurea]
SRISPAVLFIIVILAVVFFISGILHLLVRFLTKNPSPSSHSNRNNLDESISSDVLQGQLQQLFSLHDSGLDQSFIDALPVFRYSEVVGPDSNEPFDCAVCLCEFSENDQLRLLPLCSHAFHINCIDTWLLSNSTCPLCRSTLLSLENPVFEYDDFSDAEDGGCPCPNDADPPGGVQKRAETEEAKGGGVFAVRLGKFRKVNRNNDNAEEECSSSSSSRMVTRRCYSMGSYSCYVVGDANLKVDLSRNRAVPEQQRMEEGRKITGMGGTKRDSYSVSKIWLWSKKGRFDT